MVLEKTIRPNDIERVVVDTFGDSSLSFVLVNNTIVLTPIAANRNVPELAMLSESALAKEWLSPEEDEAWGFL